jgi:hypothetical protein
VLRVYVRSGRLGGLRCRDAFYKVYRRELGVVGAIVLWVGYRFDRTARLLCSSERCIGDWRDVAY